MTVSLAKLLPFRKPRRSSRVRLVCLPYAGGSAVVYRDWTDLLPPYVDVCAVELPGRSTRFVDRPVSDGHALLRELRALDALADLPIVWFGHSMGARLAFWLIHGGLRGDALVASGAPAPHLGPKKPRAHFTDDELVKELREFGGETPVEVLDDPETLELFLPMLRADFAVGEELLARPTDTLDCPISVIAATDDDEVPIAKATAWKMHAKGPYRYMELAGGHFFLTSQRDVVLAEIQGAIDDVLGDVSGS